MAVPTWGAAPATEPRFGLFPVGLRWSVALDEALSSPPGFMDAYAVLAFETGRLAAYDLQSGRAIWSVQARTSAAPVLAEGRVFLVHDRRLTVLSLEDGRDLWAVDLAAKLTAPVAAVGGWLFTIDEAAQVTALRSSDGARLWSVDAGGPVIQPAAVEGDHVYLARQDGIVRSLRVESGSLVWDRRIGGEPQPILALSDRIYVGASDNFVYCLMAADGRIDWRWRTGGDIVGVPVFDGGRIFVVSMDALARGLDRRSGAQRWKQALSLRPTRGLVAGPQALLVSGVNQTIQGLATKDGASVGTIETGGLLAGPPHVAPAPSLPSSLVVFVARSLKSGTTMTAYTRSLEPAPTPVQPLPDPNAPKAAPDGSPGTPPGTAPPPQRGAPPPGAQPPSPTDFR